MRSNDWRDMESAPLNPYGKPWGPPILIWDRATRTPVSVYFDPWYGYKDRDCGPAWVVNDGVGDSVVAPEDAGAWMPIAVPWSEQEPPESIPEGKGATRGRPNDPLDQLIEAVEAGEFPADMSSSECGIPLAMPMIFRAFSGSLDAAIFVKDTLLPEWEWKVGGPEPNFAVLLLEGAGITEDMYHMADTPARALLLAILKAYRGNPNDRTE